MKYIVTKQSNGTEEIFTFPHEIPHSIMAEAVARLKDQEYGDWRRVLRTPISAGFVEGGQCVGKSESLSLSSRPEDTALLRGQV